MNFSCALESLIEGKKIAREGWNGKSMFLFYVGGQDWGLKVGITAELDLESYNKCPFIAMKTADNKIVPWLASQTDLLGEDWITV